MGGTAGRVPDEPVAAGDVWRARDAGGFWRDRRGDAVGDRAGQHSSACGLFSIQHHFDGTLWARHAQWSAVEAALRGTSFLRLPRWLQWATGNIGFHHVHHVSSRVPNYRLEACHGAHPGFAGAAVLTLGDGLRGVEVRAVGRTVRPHGEFFRGRGVR
ncbi:MAG: fatty acid desaturase [Rhodospirillales bacterium]